MLPKNEAKYIQSLHHKKFRNQYDVFIAEGPKVVGELLLRRLEWLVKIYATAAWTASLPPETHRLVKEQLVEVAPHELEKLSALQTPQQVLASATLPATAYQPTDGWLLALDGIQDPGNLGTIIRTAHWFGLNQVVCSMDCADAFSPKVVQASMGSLFSVSVVYAELPAFFAAYEQPVYGALLDGEPVFRAGQPVPGCMVIGNEGRGIRQEVLPYITRKLTIPGSGDAESLNAAVATGILMSWMKYQ